MEGWKPQKRIKNANKRTILIAPKFAKNSNCKIWKTTNIFEKYRKTAPN